jgi:Knl1 RWD C-terminal domain
MSLLLATSKYVTNSRLDAKITAFEQNSTQVAGEKGELNAKNADMKLRIKELQVLAAQANERIFEAEKKEAELCAKIEHSEKTCADLVVFDPADLATLRGQFSVLVMTHGWRPLVLKTGRQSWVYDDVLELEFTSQGGPHELQSRVYIPIDGEKVFFF